MDNNLPPENPTNTPPVTNPEAATQTSTPVTQNTPVSTDSSFEFNETTIMAALSYFGPLVIIPYLTKKEDPFVLFHIKQGVVLLVPYLISWVLGNFMYMMFIGPLGSILSILNFVLIVLSIFGIINALKKKEKELPLVGKYSSHVKI